MKSILFIISIAFSSISLAQSSLIIFSEMGEEFAATFNGEQLSETPANRVEKHGINQEMGKVTIRFEDASKGIVTKNLFFDPNTEYVYNLKLSKKGKYVIRMVSTGPAKLQESEVVYVSEPVESTEVYETQEATQSTNTNTTINVNEETSSENVSISIQGVGISMNMQTTSQYTETSNVSIDQSSNVNVETTDNQVAEVSNTTGNCGFPTSDTEFEGISSAISDNTFEDSKLSIAQEITENKCLTSTQIKKVMELFTYEETKLDFAKFAYPYCFDPDNYFQVYSAFTFESSIGELKNHINSL